MIDAVDRAIAERQAMDRGISVGVAVSVAGHVVVVLAAIVLPILLPQPQLIHPQTAFAVILPRGGGGAPDAIEDAGRAQESRKPAENPPPAPKIVKPEREERRQGLPAPDARKARSRPEPERPTAATAAATPSGPPLPGGARGVLIGPAGPGVPGGAESGGDWYLAGVQRRIWTAWASQLKPQTQVPAYVMFTILADGSVTDVRVTQSSGVFLVDRVAQGAILNAAPFASLPRDYGTNRLTIQAVFKPTD